MGALAIWGISLKRTKNGSREAGTQRVKGEVGMGCEMLAEGRRAIDHSTALGKRVGSICLYGIVVYSIIDPYLRFIYVYMVYTLSSRCPPS